MVGEAVLRAALLLSSLLIARGFGDQAMGTFTVAFGIVQVAVMVVALGQLEVLPRETAQRPAAARGLLIAAATLQGRAALALLLPALAATLLLPEPQLRWTLLALLPFVPLRTLLLSLGASFRGLDRMDAEVRARGAALALTLPLLLAAAAAHLAVWSTGAAFSVGTAVGLLWLWRQRHQLPDSDSPPGHRQLLREGWPFLALGALTQLLLRGDALLLEALGIARATIGHYGAAITLVWGALALPQVLAAAVYPSLSRDSLHRGPALRPVLAAAAVGIAAGGALAMAFTLLAEPLVTLLFGAAYQPAAGLLAILAWALPGASASMLQGTVLAAWGRQRWSLGLQLVAVTLSITLNLTLIPRLGALGAAWAAVAVHTTLALLQLVLLLALAKRLPPSSASPADI